MGEGQVRAVWCCFAFLYNPLIRSFQRLCVCECVLVASICEWLRSTTKSEWADYAAVQAECGNLSGNELTRNSSGNTQSQSSQLAGPLWTNPGKKSWLSVRKLISTIYIYIKKIKKAQAGNKLLNILPKSLQTWKKPPPPPHVSNCLSLTLFSLPSQQRKLLWCKRAFILKRTRRRSEMNIMNIKVQTAQHARCWDFCFLSWSQDESAPPRGKWTGSDCMITDVHWERLFECWLFKDM